jgi:Tfp pilus assembly protein PilF
LALEQVPVQQRLIALPAVWDDVRSVRIQAARLLADYPAGELREDRQAKLDTVIEEYIQTQKFSGERAQAQINLASLYQDRQQFEEAENAYEKALQLQPQYMPAYVNFAYMLSGLGRELEAASLLTSGIALIPGEADLHHSLGLSKIRQQKAGEAIADLARSAQLAPNNRRYQYVYAIALQSTGQIDTAIEVLQASLERFSTDPDTLHALATISRDAGRREAALEYATQLQALIPGNPTIDQLVLSLQP